MELFYQTRDPFLGKMTYTRDAGFQQDYNRWLINPKYCSEYKMTNSPSYPNIPRDLFDAELALPLLPDIDLPDILSPLSTSSASNLHRMCTPKVGANVPFTIHNSPQGVEILAALQNIEKGSRLSYAFFKEFIETNPEYSSVFTFRMINESTDKIQFTYHDNTPTQCYRFGQLGELFSGANAMVKKGDYGLYSSTVWNRHTCHMGLGRMLALLPWFVIFGPIIAGLALFS